ncbi:uncharacterized protein LOC116255547 [Nymphaea colorata]|nr:uncharacterized protein LOC116255547 [Nymphaea colorata]
MEGGSGGPVGERTGSSSGATYALRHNRPCNHEDIIFCIDIDRQSQADMKVTGAKGRPITRLDAIKQAILLFLHAKLRMNPNHRFAFSALSHSASWIRREFSGDVDLALSALRSISADLSYDQADLSQLFKMAAYEGRRCRAQSRILRVILIYCRSSVQPEFHWPEGQKLFTLDVLYLHDKPSPDNCPQKVYDTLVDALEHVGEHEGYIFESGGGLTRVLFKQMCLLLSHPQQRCSQEDLDIPKSVTKKVPVTEGHPVKEEETPHGSNQ